MCIKKLKALACVLDEHPSYSSFKMNKILVKQRVTSTYLPGEVGKPNYGL